MNAVGIDVSKGKSMVAIMRPFGEIVSTPFEIKHTSSDINSLIEIINSVEGESRIVMEHTGRYTRLLPMNFRRQIFLLVLLILNSSRTLITIHFAKSNQTKLILLRLPVMRLTSGKT